MSGSDRPWINVLHQLPPTNVVVDSKIEDHKGVRNEQQLKMNRNLWWFPDGSMYVYYSPTHWRHSIPTQ